jgi:hypothetical protein
LAAWLLGCAAAFLNAPLTVQDKSPLLVEPDHCPSIQNASDDLVLPRGRSAAKSPICTAAPNEPSRPLSKATRTLGLLSISPCACQQLYHLLSPLPFLILALQTAFLGATSATRPWGLLNSPNVGWTNATCSVVPLTETRSANGDAVGVSAQTTRIHCQFLSLVLALRGSSWTSMRQKMQKETQLSALAQDSFHRTGG